MSSLTTNIDNVHTEGEAYVCMRVSIYPQAASGRPWADALRGAVAPSHALLEPESTWEGSWMGRQQGAIALSPHSWTICAGSRGTSSDSKSTLQLNPTQPAQPVDR